jgi:hypothetical protein
MKLPDVHFKKVFDALARLEIRIGYVIARGCHDANKGRGIVRQTIRIVSLDDAQFRWVRRRLTRRWKTQLGCPCGQVL